MSAEISAIEKLWRRMLLVVGRGRITTGDDSGMVQRQQVLLSAAEIRDDTIRVAEYGFTSMPLPGCHGVVVFIGGDRSNGVIIATNDQNHRLKNLKPGEVAIYDDQGQSVWLKRTGIEVNGAGLPILVHNTPTITLKADTSITLDAPLVHSTGNHTVDALFTTLNFAMVAGGAAKWGSGGGGTMSFNNMTVTYTGGAISHDGHVIDKSHVHPVTAVGSNTGTPV
ncbi:phage baseplate assembly protein V [Variovorax sp. PBL-E5]|uniref:phage baseplate assembly protein V n=1 Tax=Variovorax sp. PBL-E5 TaxID=434014 RepID=UPI00131740C5|nr:phage baseplate assembly protein V [Variovorax sp. PBL-E5]VTU28444.1 phage baseplate assembly protein V [Variovorax sp. PBL-E5]